MPPQGGARHTSALLTDEGGRLAHSATHRAHAAETGGRARGGAGIKRAGDRERVREFSRTRTARGAGVRPPAENKYAQARRPGAGRADNARKSYTATMDYEMQ
jgi:hypothetical protein